MRLLLFLLVTGVFFIPSHRAWAICLPEGCQQITLEIQSCSFTTVSNKEDIEKYIQNSNLDSAMTERWKSKIVEYRGLTLEGRVQEASRIPCVEGQKPQEGFPLRLHKGFSGKFFFLDSGASCQELDNVLVANFHSDCCDTLPATGTCIIGEALLQPPSRRQKNGGASNSPMEIGSDGAGKQVLPKKGDMFEESRF